MMKKKNKPIPEAKDAKEVAKKLIRSGAIAAIQVCTSMRDVITPLPEGEGFMKCISRDFLLSPRAVDFSNVF